ncbi:MAG TPA: prephenate dehydratase [Solirubrobacteraceae bacterium]|nr:prephenate dehydratase [Solirubrobacteraceae bacterium]
MSEPAEGDPPRRVAFLGPAGTFSEEALLSSASPGAVEPVPMATIPETVAALRDGSVEFAVVPIENSLEGSINVTLDLLAGQAGGVRIVGEALLRVRHFLIAARSLEPAQIRTVISHPQVPGQCARFLRAELPQAAITAAASTAEAVRGVVAAGDEETAALGTALAAEIYGGVVLRAGVEDREDNETRFVWLARSDDAGAAPPLREPGGEPRCALVFWGQGARHAGWLVRCLDEFAARDINLHKIESRPRREQLGDYMFFLELAGEEHEEDVAAALDGLRALCERVLVLGSYRAAEPASAAAGSGAPGPGGASARS